MSHISPAEQAAIVKVLRAWRQRPITWELLKAQLEGRLALNGQCSWSRQSLSAKPAIAKAFKAAKGRLSRQKAGHASGPLYPGDEVQIELSTLRTELAETVRRYEDLLLRHRALLSAVALLPGGANLMIEP